MRIPRLVVAAPRSGGGKTTVATGLMAALRSAGLEVSGHKVGPDYIDPGYHAVATGRPGRNLDPRLQGEDLLRPLFLHGARSPRPADVAVVEGVMGLFDGALGQGGYASTAHIARVLDAPVLLVVDAASAGRSVAATVLGCLHYEKGLRIGGVVLNRVGSQRHADEAVRAVEELGVGVLGVLRRDRGALVPSRHLGLVPALEREGAAAGTVERQAALVAAGVDLPAVLSLARSAPDLPGSPWDPAERLGEHPGGPGGNGDPSPGSAPVIAVAAGPVFTFRYAETTELLRAAGGDVVEFDPLTAPGLPEGTAALYLGGGFPQMHAEALADNLPLRRAVADRVAGRMPVVAECAGLLYLCRELDGHPMAGVLPATARMTDRLALGYRTATAPGHNLLVGQRDRGTSFTGHEFHRTAVLADGSGGAGGSGAVRGTDGSGAARGVDGSGGPGDTDRAGGTGPARGGRSPARRDTTAWRLRDGTGTVRSDGFAGPRLHASYLHLHWAAAPRLAERLVERAREHVHRPADRSGT